MVNRDMVEIRYRSVGRGGECGDVEFCGFGILFVSYFYGAPSRYTNKGVGT